jgi:hypothetical protein
MDYTVCGPAVNLAARLQQDSQRGEIVLDRFTAIDSDGIVNLLKRPKILPKGFEHGHDVTPFVVTGQTEASMVEVRNLLKKLLSEGFFLEHVIPSSTAGRSVTMDGRLKWAQHLTAIAHDLLDGDLRQALVK